VRAKGAAEGRIVAAGAAEERIAAEEGTAAAAICHDGNKSP